MSRLTVRKYDVKKESETKTLVSLLNNWMKKHKYLFSDYYFENIIKEIGFVYDSKNENKLKFVWGNNLCESMFSVSDAKKIIEDGISIDVINILQCEG